MGEIRLPCSSPVTHSNVSHMKANRLWSSGCREMLEPGLVRPPVFEAAPVCTIGHWATLFVGIHRKVSVTNDFFAGHTGLL